MFLATPLILHCHLKLQQSEVEDDSQGTTTVFLCCAQFVFELISVCGRRGGGFNP